MIKSVFYDGDIFYERKHLLNGPSLYDGVNFYDGNIVDFFTYEEVIPPNI
jgi:hypothetical protein